jgi:hypothetical protein
MDKRQVERYEPNSNVYYWEISFFTFNELPLSNEQYHEVAKAIEDKMEEIRSRRSVGSVYNK